MTRLRLLSLLAGAVLLCGPVRAQEPPAPPETEADALRMLASGDYRERDAAVDFVARRVHGGLSVDPELRDAMIRLLTSSAAWSAGRPKIDPETNPDGWGEHWSIQADVVSRMRDPAAIPFMLARWGSPYDLAAIGRPALLPVIEALEDPEADPQRALDLSLRALTLMVHDGLPTEEERVRIVATTWYRLETRLSLPNAVSAFGLAITLGTPELLAMVEHVANDRDAADAMRAVYTTERRIQTLQERAREALQPGFVPSVIRHRRE